MNYEMTIGLEVHAELNTATKIYCSCKKRFWCGSQLELLPDLYRYAGNTAHPERKGCGICSQDGPCTEL